MQVFFMFCIDLTSIFHPIFIGKANFQYFLHWQVKFLKFLRWQCKFFKFFALANCKLLLFFALAMQLLNYFLHWESKFFLFFAVSRSIFQLSLKWLDLLQEKINFENHNKFLLFLQFLLPYRNQMVRTIIYHFDS